MEADKPYEGHKFRSLRDEMLHRLTLDGWANESSGNVEAPTGWFARITITPAELHEVVEAFSSDFKESGFSLTGSLVGHFLMREDTQGFVEVTDYPDERTLLHEYHELETAFSTWDVEEK